MNCRTLTAIARYTTSYFSTNQVITDFHVVSTFSTHLKLVVSAVTVIFIHHHKSGWFLTTSHGPYIVFLILFLVLIECRFIRPVDTMLRLPISVLSSRISSHGHHFITTMMMLVVNVFSTLFFLVSGTSLSSVYLGCRSGGL